jgi:type I restriction enzyme, S subunit
MRETQNISKNNQIKRLGEVCTYTKGKKPTVLTETKTKDFSVPYINIKAFEKGIISEYTNGEKCNICNEDDLLMVWDGARCGLIGKAKKGAVGSTLMKILPKENIHKEYLYHFISSKFWTLNTKPKGVGIPHIEPTLLWNFELVVTPLREQQAIVAKIEELLRELENGKQQLQTAQQQLKIYKQSLLKWAFEGKLTNKDVKDGELPKGWKEVTIGDIFEIHIGSTPKRNNPKYWGGNINWLSSGEIAFRNITSTREKITTEGLENTSCKVHPIGTVMIAMIGEGKTRGQAAILKIASSHNQNTAAIRVDENIYKSQLLYYYLVLKYEDNRRVGSGNNQKALNKERVKSIPIPLPTIREQQLILDELERKLTVCDKIEDTISQSLQQAETLRQSILKKAFEGKLV